MAWTQQQIDTAKDMYSKGALSLELDGEKVTFVNGDEFRRRIRDMEAALENKSRRMTVSFPKTGRGL